jgi:hypothetical protein
MSGDGHSGRRQCGGAGVRCSLLRWCSCCQIEMFEALVRLCVNNFTCSFFNINKYKPLITSDGEILVVHR